MRFDAPMLYAGLAVGLGLGLTGFAGFLLGKRAKKTSGSARPMPPAGIETASDAPKADYDTGLQAGINAKASLSTNAQGGIASCEDADAKAAVTPHENMSAAHAAPRTAAEATRVPTDSSEAPDVPAPGGHMVVYDPDFDGLEDEDVAHSAIAADGLNACTGDAAKPSPARDNPLDMDEFARDLAVSENPIRQLKRFARDVKKQAKAAREGKANEPDAISAYLTRGLEEAGLLKTDTTLPELEVVLPGRSHTIFLRTHGDVSEQEMRSVIAVEGTLNRALFAWEHAGMQGLTTQPDDHDAEGLAEPNPQANSGTTLSPSGLQSADANSENNEDEANAPAAESLDIEDCYVFNQALADSLCAQLGHSPIPRASMFDVAGEWGVRQTFSAGIESLRTPLRLTARYRVNLMGGDIAIETPFVPASCHPASLYSFELGRVIDASHQMREQMATNYALRCAIMLAAHAFRCSRRLCHAYVAVMGSGRTRRCLISGNVSREVLREHDLSLPFNPRKMARELGLRFNLENDRLTGVEQGFSLESEKFCPASRYEVIDLSTRVLPRFEAELLGAERVSDLSINEDAHRIAVAEDVASGLGGSVERNVRRILNITQADRDQTVREAGKRCAEALISGDLAENDPLAFTDEFVSGDTLSRACERALELLGTKGHAGAQETIDLLTNALAPIDALDTYSDADGISWRNFSSYVARALYNRLLAHEGEQVKLVPDAYYGAQLLLSSALLQQGRAEQALGFARRACDLNPFDMSGALRAVRALELKGDLEGAAAELRRNLELAHDPQGVGTLYYRLAYIEWKLDQPELSDACYQKAIVSRATCSNAARVELAMLRAHNGGQGVEPEEVEDLLAANGIPLAPTERVLEVLVEAAQGATDAEVFPVAKSFATLLGALSADDVMHGVAASIEHEPDR